VISVTFQFKTLEGARAAMLEIPESSLVGNEDATVAVIGPKPIKAKPAVTPTAAETAPAKAEAAAGSPSEGKAEAPKPEPVATISSEKPSESVAYPVLQKAVFALAGKSRDAVVAIAASFGAKTFKELPEAKWGEALAAVNAKLAELEGA